MTETPTDSWPTVDTTLVGAPPPPVAPAPPPPDRRIGAGMLLALTVIVLAAAGVAVAYFFTHRSTAGGGGVTTVVLHSTAQKPKAVALKKVAVPRVVGLKEQQALVQLARLGLRPKEVFRPTKQPKGVVVSQRPQEAKEVAKGTRVTLVVDAGAAQVAIPSLSGKPLADAQAALGRLGLDSAVTQVTSDQPANTVVDQAPKPGAKLAKGSTVTLSVAKASPTTTGQTTTTAGTTTSAGTTTASTPATPQNATVPEVTNQTEAQAVQSLNQAGILASLFFVPSNDPLGTVEQQSKPSGTSVAYHAHMQINVSAGPGDKPKERVPDVVGETLQQALGAINGAHLRLLYVRFPVSSHAQAGKIVQQSPLGGGTAPQNAQVVVFLGSYGG